MSRPILVLCLLGSLMVLACSSIDYAGRGDSDLGVTLSPGDYRFLSENLAMTTPSAPGSYKDILATSDAKKFKDFICKKKVLKQRLIAVIPKFPGRPIAEAASYQEECRTKVRKLAKTFYSDVVFDWGDNPYYVAATELPENVGIDDNLVGSDEDKESWVPVAYGSVFYPHGNMTYLYPMNALGFKSKRLPTYPNGRVDYPPLPLSVPVWKPELRMTRLAELVGIADNFTPVLPDNILGSIQGRDGFNDECSSATLLAKGPDSYCWKSVFGYSTSVKESVQKGNPNVINFDVSLDLDLFCKYGRPNSDLVSK